MNDTNQTITNQRLVIISNRLPVILSKEDNGSLKMGPGSGGLVTALAPVLKNRGGLWIGWAGTSEEEQPQEVLKLMENVNRSVGFSLHPVFLTKEDVELYYEGFSNKIIWPLFHDLQSECRFDPSYWAGYQKANRKFAETVLQKVRRNDFIWIHDYQLLLLGQELKKIGVTSSLAFFLHIPFPSLDIFLKLPWRFQILRALLDFDFIGFQTVRDWRNFTYCVRTLLPEITIDTRRHLKIFKMGTREVRVGAFPISIDYKEFMQDASNKDVADRAWILHEKLPDHKIIFSLDRLDYSKGIPYRFEAIRYLLKKYPELHQKVTFIQVVVPSRTNIPEYQNLKAHIDKLVGEINSEFTHESWVPIHYVFRSLDRKELLAHYRTSEAILITPLKDGMNLVVKEYIASNIEETGAVILSEFAGAAVQLQNEAILINPYDIVGLAEAIRTAVTLPEDERKKRMRKMRRNVRHYDIFWWLRSFLSSAISKELRDFPLLEEYLPSETKNETHELMQANP
jgi:trehalose 6-phosphate synthase/phosphatase